MEVAHIRSREHPDWPPVNREQGTMDGVEAVGPL